ncbi:SDR family NAD(P)-dependent oxidoreductase [Acinetobacter rudis]|uniref:SDR family NAD(P)-dependent oxidoreductase n=1 Tax=Acinetobacter rudis TaxID=632955 RepID=A0AAW8J7C1_9GAMM|nr:SDR family NAD(P)-dependent oxidoreductase [Acinetobacter rudis]MDQ8934480.1 SDR family NAD(P)-dependent oxidoreductase [Acinetobacter rudis]MDQ9016620.1 SDR family NAD(P)-dependent oxidoreductase [Acinetobacter rudis]
MKKSLVIFGYGLGISRSVAIRFGQEGFELAIVARDKRRLKDAVSELKEFGIKAHAFNADLSDLNNIPSLIDDIRNKLGSIQNILWNAFQDDHGDLIELDPSSLTQAMHLRVSSYIAVVQTCLKDLEINKGSVLSTNGMMALDRPEANVFAIDYASLAIAATAQYKTTNILVHTLMPQGIFVGQIIVNGFVQGTAGVQNSPENIEPEAVANKFWELFQHKNIHFDIVSKES